MKKKDLRDLLENSVPELQKKIKTLVLDLKKIQMDHVTGKSKNTNIKGLKKKDIARIKTVLKIKEMASK